MQLESTTGTLFLSTVLRDKGPLSFMGAFRLTRNHFSDVELKLIDIIQNYIDLYKSVPDKNFVEIEIKAEIPDPPTSGSVSFWADEVRKRYAVENSYMLCKDILSKITEGDIDSAADASSRMTRILIEGQTKTRVYGLEDTYDNILEVHDQARLNYSAFGIPFGLDFLDKSSGGAQGGDLITIAARPGCLSGDTIIPILRSSSLTTKTSYSYRKYSLRTAYYRFNGLLIPDAKKGENQKWRGGKTIKTYTMSCNDDGSINKNEIKNILYSGRKKVFKVTTRCGFSIKATAEHRFLIGNGIYAELKDLCNGDLVQVYSGKTKPSWVKKLSPYRQYVSGIVYHPYASKHIVGGKNYKRMPLARLIVEAELNKLLLEEYINILKTGSSKIASLKFIEPGLEIHHLDGNPSNNDLSNLKIMTSAEHAYLHGKTSSYDINGLSGVMDPIVSIEYVGEEDTYDIEMAESPHNFRANDFFVHNSGKTFLLLHMALTAFNAGKNVMLIPTEMSEIQYHRRLAALRNNISINKIKFGELSSIIGIPILKYDKELLEKSENKFYMTDASMSLGMLDVKSSTYVYKPDALYIDGAYLLRPETYAKSRYEMVSSVAESLKMLAKEMNIPVIATYQINKKTDDIYQSDVVRQLSSIVIELSDKDETDGETWVPGIKPKVLKITKGRDGEEGGTLILLDTNYTRIVESDADIEGTDEGDRCNSSLEVDGV